MVEPRQQFSDLPQYRPILFTIRRRVLRQVQQSPKSNRNDLHTANLCACFHYEEITEANECFGRFSLIPRVSRARRPSFHQTACLLSAMQRPSRQRMLYKDRRIPSISLFLLRLLNVFHSPQPTQQSSSFKLFNIVVNVADPVAAKPLSPEVSIRSSPEREENNVVRRADFSLSSFRSYFAPAILNHT